MDINVGERIRHFRCAKGLTVNKLANLAGISQSYLRDIELGNNSNPTIEVLDCLCQTLGISLKEFFDTYENQEHIEQSLLHEISNLTLTQQENLKLFLKSINN